MRTVSKSRCSPRPARYRRGIAPGSAEGRVGSGREGGRVLPPRAVARLGRGRARVVEAVAGLGIVGPGPVAWAGRPGAAAVDGPSRGAPGRPAVYGQRRAEETPGAAREAPAP